MRVSIEPRFVLETCRTGLPDSSHFGTSGCFMSMLSLRLRAQTRRCARTVRLGTLTTRSSLGSG